ncbi:MAG: DUF177 domain-containing protein [Clostridia bacterium]
MNMFELDIALARKNIGKQCSVRLSGDMEETSYYGRELMFCAPVSCDLSYSFDGEDIILTGDCKTSIVEHCARCNKECFVDISFDIDERLVKNGSEGDFYYNAESADLHDMLFELILLNMPIAVLCKEDCKGLCPKCGIDLNFHECACKEIDESPFSVLSGFFNDDKEV